MIKKTVVTLLLVASAYISLHLLSTYIDALLGRNGGGDAQWQFAFVLAPIPCALGLISFAIARPSRPPLSRLFLLCSLIAAVVPLVLFGLVFTHA